MQHNLFKKQDDLTYFEPPQSSNIFSLLKASGFESFIQTALERDQATDPSSNHCHLLCHGILSRSWSVNAASLRQQVKTVLMFVTGKTVTGFKYCSSGYLISSTIWIKCFTSQFPVCSSPWKKPSCVMLGLMVKSNLFNKVNRFNNIVPGIWASLQLSSSECRVFVFESLFPAIILTSGFAFECALWQ